MTGREQRVDHEKHGVDPSGQVGGRGDPVRDPGKGDLLLGPGDASGHRRSADQEHACNLGSGQAAEQPQRQGHLRGPVERGVAARHDEAQPVVGDGHPVAVVDRLLRAWPGLVLNEQREVFRLHPAMPQDVECAPPCGRGQPGPWTCWHARTAPARERGREGVLRALFGDVQVTRHAHRRGEHEGPLAAVRISDGGRDPGCVHDGHAARSRGQLSNVMMGRTSTPPKRAGTVLATASAESRSGASMT